MKQRILRNWTVRRVLYVILGLGIIVDSIAKTQWPETLLGGYFFSMGLFSFGCAGGSCSTGVYMPGNKPDKHVGSAKK